MTEENQVLEFAHDFPGTNNFTSLNPVYLTVKEEKKKKVELSLETPEDSEVVPPRMKRET